MSTSPTDEPSPTPWAPPSAAVGLSVWLVTSPVEEETWRLYQALQPTQVMWGPEAPRPSFATGAVLDSEQDLRERLGRAGEGPWVVVAGKAWLRSLVEGCLGILPTGSAALPWRAGTGLLLRADAPGWTLERAGIEDPGLSPAADLGDGISE